MGLGNMLGNAVKGTYGGILNLADWTGDKLGMGSPGAAKAWKAEMAELTHSSTAAKAVRGFTTKAGIGVAAVAALVAAPFVISDLRKKRRAPVEMSPNPAMVAQQPVMVDPQAQSTLMGMQPVTDGAWSQRLDAQGAGAGYSRGGPAA